MRSEGILDVSAKHWPGSWCRRPLEKPSVRAAEDNATTGFQALAIVAGGAEHGRLEREHLRPMWFQFLTGYPPRRFSRLEPG